MHRISSCKSKTIALRPALSPFFIFLSAASTYHAIIGGIFSGSVCIATAWSLPYNSEYHSYISAMIEYCSWIPLPCLARSVIIRLLSRIWALQTFYNGLQALRCPTVYSISSNLCFRMTCLSFFFMGLIISIHSMWSLGVLFSIISLHFFFRTIVDDYILGFFCFLVCFPMLVAFGFIISVMFLFGVSMSSTSSSAANLFFFRLELIRVFLCSNHLSVNYCLCILV